MKWASNFWGRLPGLVVLAILATVMASQASAQKKPPKKEKPPKEAPSQDGQIRIFKLEHASPNEMQVVIKRLLSSPEVLLATDGRTRSLIVLASEENLEIAADLVKVLDSPPGKTLPKVKNVGVFPLSHMTPGEFVDLSKALKLSVTLFPMEKARLLIATGDLKNLGLLVQELDVPGRRAPPREKRRILLEPVEPYPKELIR